MTFPSDADIKAQILAPELLEKGSYEGTILDIELQELKSKGSVPKVRALIEGRERFLYLSGTPSALRLIMAAVPFLKGKVCLFSVIQYRIEQDTTYNAFEIEEVR